MFCRKLQKETNEKLLKEKLLQRCFFFGKNEAECKFWQTPELIEELLPNLDPESTLRLAQAHERTRNILEGSRVWKNLIKRSSPLHLRDDLFSVCHFVAILKLMKDTKANMLDLLDAISIQTLT